MEMNLVIPASVRIVQGKINLVSTRSVERRRSGMENIEIDRKLAEARA
jgi:hypothetical protein